MSNQTWPVQWAASSHTPRSSPGSNSSPVESISSAPFQFASSAQSPKRSSTPYRQTFSLNCPPSGVAQPSHVRPAVPVSSSLQRPSKKQKQLHISTIESCAQTYVLGHGVLDSRQDLATSMGSKPDQMAMWDDCEQSLEEVRSELAQGGGLLLRRRLGFLR